ADAAKFDDSYRKLPEKLKSAAARGVAEAFVQNMDRIRAMVEFAPLAMGVSSRQIQDAQADDARQRMHPAYKQMQNYGIPGTGMARSDVYFDERKAVRWDQDPLPENL